MISVVIPARNEAATLGETLAHLRTWTADGAGEIVVAVGGSTDDTAAIAARAARVVEGPEPSRAALLNAGAGAARGDSLFFLHADTLPPPGYLLAIEAALADPAVVGGAFDFEFRERAWRLAAISAMNRLRCRLTGNFYGDQGIFVRRAVFDRIGGFPRRKLFEDLLFSQAMRRVGRTVLLRGRRVRASGRRLLAPDWTRTVGLMTWLLALHTLGCDTESYAERYHAPRTSGPPT
ncbi:MAG TPA: TIGR04283 family arsenosugar biosynthesis glycosyltransferase [Methylomirabilota bacterium]|jgi:rSAM/selenodomain-associated transferase 2|nr:TIGR04283 family arsenosugar biosynthesis glycosyltransferase [Methylomirabilota bacterium]